MKTVGKKNFSQAEIEILKWLKEGKTNEEIGQIMGLTKWTISFHLRKIMEKLDVSNRIQVVSEAINQNLIAPRKLKKIIKEKLLLNITDELTGLYNRRYLMEHIKKEIKRAGRHNRFFSIVIVGIKVIDAKNRLSYFKMNNILKKLAECLIKVVRTTDTVGRMGRDKFCIIMPEIEKKGTAAFTKRLLHEIISKDLYAGKVLLSEGIATFPEDGKTCSELIRKTKIHYLTNKSLHLSPHINYIRSRGK